MNYPYGGIHFPQCPVRERVFPARIWQGERGVHAAGLLRFSGVAAEHFGACGGEGIFDAETVLRLAGSAVAGATNSAEKTPQGIPFNVGIWVGTDGRSVIAALNPGGCWRFDWERSDQESGPKTAVGDGSGGGAVPARRGGPEDWPGRIRIDGEASGIFADYHYYGTGDTGGSPTPNSVRMMEAMIDKSKIVPSAGRKARPAGSAELNSSVTGEVVATNAALKDDPSLVNSDPYGKGWFIKVKSPNADLSALMTADQYNAKHQ